MPVPIVELDAQQVVILAAQLDVSAKIDALAAAVGAPAIEAAEADLLASRKALGVEVAKLVDILYAPGNGFAPPTRPGSDYELIYQVAYGLAPAF